MLVNAEDQEIEVTLIYKDGTTFEKTFKVAQILDKGILVEHKVDGDHYFVFNSAFIGDCTYIECDAPFSINDPLYTEG